MDIEITVVAYKKEFLQLLLLLKSINKFLKFHVNKINIITQEAGDAYKFSLLEIIGGVINTGKFNISIVCQREVLEKEIDSNDGWKIQQILKIFHSRNADADYTILLDTKNHLIKDLNLADLFAGSSALYFTRSEQCHLSASSPMLQYFINSYGLFDLDALEFIDNSLGTITPYIFHNQSINSMVSYLERQHRSNFIDIFFSKEVSEFYLYNAFLRKVNKFHLIYQRTDLDRVLTIWGDEISDAAFFALVMKQIESGSIAFLGLHKSALSYLKSNPDASYAPLIEKIESVWLACGLVEKPGLLSELINNNPLTAFADLDIPETYKHLSGIFGQ